MTEVIRLRRVSWAASDEGALRKRVDALAPHFAPVGPSEEFTDIRTIQLESEHMDVCWDDCAGETGMLSAFGAHLLATTELIAGRASAAHLKSLWHRFAVVRGRLAQWSEEGFDLQSIRASDPAALRAKRRRPPHDRRVRGGGDIR